MLPRPWRVGDVTYGVDSPGLVVFVPAAAVVLPDGVFDPFLWKVTLDWAFDSVVRSVYLDVCVEAVGLWCLLALI